jgi:hypothetical protein
VQQLGSILRRMYMTMVPRDKIAYPSKSISYKENSTSQSKLLMLYRKYQSNNSRL